MDPKRAQSPTNSSLWPGEFRHLDNAAGGFGLQLGLEMQSTFRKQNHLMTSCRGRMSIVDEFEVDPTLVTLSFGRDGIDESCCFLGEYAKSKCFEAPWNRDSGARDNRYTIER